jgi:hypothetical protein
MTTTAIYDNGYDDRHKAINVPAERYPLSGDESTWH